MGEDDEHGRSGRMLGNISENTVDEIEPIQPIEDDVNIVGIEQDSAAHVESQSSCGRGRGRGHGLDNLKGNRRKRGGEDIEAAEGSSKQSGNSGRRLTSNVWNHFKRQKNEKGELDAICNYCGKVLTGKYSSGTSHLKKHYECCLRKTFRDVNQMHLQYTTKRDGTTSLENIAHPKCDMIAVRIAIARMIILHELPLSFVEYHGFRGLLELLQPTIETISRNTIKNEILKLYELEKSRIICSLESCESRIAITTDMWTASNQKKGYMVVTAHYIDNLWVLRSCIIRFIYVPAPHTGEVMCNVLHECLMDWNIDRKLSTLTVDNCSANDSMIDMLLDKFSQNSLIMGGKIFHMRCCAHILNLIVKDGMSVMEKGVENIRDSVLYWTATPGRVEKFEAAVRQLGMKETKKLVLDCKTRWNSTFLMLSTASLYKDAFVRLKERDKNYKCLPCESEWELAKIMCEHLKVFSKLTEIFSGTRYPTSNLFFPKICEIRLAMNLWEKSHIEGIRKMASKMVSKYEKYWDIIHGVMAVGNMLDPRFKKLMIHFFFPKIYGETSSYHIDRVFKIFSDLVHEYEAKHAMAVDEDGGGALGIGSSRSGSTTRSTVLMDESIAGEWDSFISQEINYKQSKSELETYLDEGVLPPTSNFDILSWWSNNKGKYPVLAEIARDFLAIPVSTVASESAFSTSGRHLSPHRSRLHPDTVEALMCTQNWFWSEIRGREMLEDSEVDEQIINASQMIDPDDLKLC